jgi:hypothetical protein
MRRCSFLPHLSWVYTYRLKEFKEKGGFLLHTWHLQWIQALCGLFLFVSLFAAIYYPLKGLRVGRRRRMSYQIGPGVQVKRVPEFWLRLFAVSEGGSIVEECRQSLAGSGLSVDARHYIFLKRISVLGLIVSVIVIVPAREDLIVSGLVNPYYLLIFCVLGIAAALLDKSILSLIEKYRSQRIVADIYKVCSQLLYYQGSNLNLHTRLVRCVPHTSIIQNHMHLLVNEWYSDAETAIHRFKYRLGTDEAYGFAETLNALRLNDSEHYYQLLRQRLKDYKEKLDLYKESKSESRSYVFFVIAGIPILNTFRVFVYPWIAEGQQLFQSLN